MCCNPSCEALLFGFSLGCWFGANQATKKATTLGSLSNPTSRPLYQGAGMPEEQDKNSHSMQVQHHISLVERRVAGLIPCYPVHLLPSNLVTMRKIILVPILCPLRPIFVNCGRITLIVIMCNVAACSD